MQLLIATYFKFNARNRLNIITKKLRCQAVNFALYRKKVEMSKPFPRDKTLNFAHVFNVPLPSVLLLASSVFLFFLLEMWDPLRSKYAKKENKISGEKRKTKKTFHSYKGRQGHIKHVCKKSRAVFGITCWYGRSWHRYSRLWYFCTARYRSRIKPRQSRYSNLK